MTLEDLRSAIALVLENSDDNEYDDNPPRTYCCHCGWDSRKDLPLGDKMHCLHKPECELLAAREMLQAFVDDEEDVVDASQPSEPCAAATAAAAPVDAAELANDAAVDEAVHRLLRCLALYGNYEVRARGPMGLLLDSIRDLRPDVVEFLHVSCEHGKSNSVTDAAGDALKCFFPEESDGEWPCATSVRVENGSMIVSLQGGVSLGIPLSRYPRIAAASAPQQEAWELAAGGAVIRWPALGESVFVAALFVYPWAKAPE